MSLLRPEAVGTLLRWREAAIGAGAALLGLYWIVTDPGIMRWVGVAFVLGGIAIAREGLSRARRPIGGGGAGIVEVDERRVTYLSGVGGGSVSVDSLERVHVETMAEDPLGAAARWVLTPEDGPPLAIPTDAEGASRIFDVLAALPGADHGAAIRATGGAQPGATLIWERPESGKPRLPH